MIDTLPDAKLELDRANALLEEAKQRTATRRADLDEAKADEREAHAIVTAARKRVADFEAEPAARLELEDLTGRLRRALAAPPAYPGDARSPTRGRVSRELEAVSDDTRLSAHDKLDRIKALATDFNERRTLDSLHFANSEVRR